MTRILIVEDDAVINQVLAEFLKEHQYEIVSCLDGQKALEYFETEKFDLIILDIMVPNVSGLDILKKIRETSQVPVIMLTAMDDEYTQLVSFNHLISDYVVKPFSPLILMKRIENVFRQSESANVIEISGVVIDLEASEVYVDNETLPLTKTEYEVLEMLAKHKGKLVTRDQLMNSIWGYTELEGRILDNHIKNIRKKVPQIPLVTLVGRGYKIEEEENEHEHS
ncbi:response regulator transcription factor [Streptococcus ruminantium]|uniref:Response regulator transcription factor n=1 Tax=Streptococcus ruminantium TaxID=1917441 RepID=A0ABU1B5F6_9STRE|nr:response regulator transcription factor [Streptococcus ruminantium]MDQ8759387.1 response regulator transcription factor [Streptococcus ruminantium]MDQ8764958.1 response regulator transcription factor [Streptococcus ruminantium]MDQ8767671.1 response regulator transcription factor [Streptococcus ruminantium]MDQ8769747.1 response regulator transcription factor [Streptococcus ruminantium]MDQ8780119.1 response regulator transcription factor [Streptococcus ruminantium]